MIIKIPFAHDSAVVSQPCPSGHITADKKGNQRFPPNSPIGKLLLFAKRYTQSDSGGKIKSEKI